MNLGPWLWVHLQAGLLAAALIAWLLARARGPSWARRRIPPLALGLAVLPIGDLDLTAQLLPYTGTLSLPSLVLLAGLGASRLLGREGFPQHERETLGWLLAAAALALYPLALGLGPWDPYGLGFSGPWLPGTLGLLAALAWWTGRPRVAGLLLGVLWAWALGIGESDNLWDYLLDPWVGLGALAWVLGRALAWIKDPAAGSGHR